MLVPIPQPYDFELSTVRFRDLGNDSATVWHDGGVHRVVAEREIRVVPAPGGVQIDPDGREAAEEIGRILGVPFDLSTFRTWAATDPVLGPIVLRLDGFRPTLNPQPFEALIVAITTQQISLRAAAAIRGRFVQRFGNQHEIAWEFPLRDRIAKASPEEIVSIGFSRKKAEYVVGLARSDLNLAALADLDDEDLTAALTALPGLGRWTADWYLARHLARPHAWPAGDLGLRKAVSTFYADGRSLSIQEVRAMGARFAPFENLSAQFLLAGARLFG